MHFRTQAFNKRSERSNQVNCGSPLVHPSVFAAPSLALSRSPSFLSVSLACVYHPIHNHYQHSLQLCVHVPLVLGEHTAIEYRYTITNTRTTQTIPISLDDGACQKTQCQIDFRSRRTRSVCLDVFLVVRWTAERPHRNRMCVRSLERK